MLISYTAFQCASQRTFILPSSGVFRTHLCIPNAEKGLRRLLCHYSPANSTSELSVIPQVYKLTICPSSLQSLKEIKKKVNSGSYRSLVDFRDDVYLMLSNAMTYVRCTPFYFRLVELIKAGPQNEEGSVSRRKNLCYLST